MTESAPLMSTVNKFFPWLGPDGRVSPIKLIIFAALFLPGFWVAFALDQGLLGPRPVNAAIHEIGLWTIRLLLLSLAVTPLRQILRWPDLALTRRMIGVGAFAYAVTHLMLYIIDEKYNLAKVASEIYLRVYLTIGFTALLGLTALAVTSTDRMIARLGGRAWRRLHRLIFVVAVLALIHAFMQSKADVWQPMWMAGLFAWLVGYRLLLWRRRRGGLPLPWVFALAPLAAAATAVGEAVYFWAATGVDPLLVLGANLGTLAGTRPSWIVLAVGLLVAFAGVLRRITKRSGRATAAAGSVQTSTRRARLPTR